MFEISGKYNTATVMAETVDETTHNQIIQICSCLPFKDSQIVIMPDAHAGAGTVIGTTIYEYSGVVPNVVGVDIGCGVLTYVFDNSKASGVDYFPALDQFIRENIPSGFSVREETVNWANHYATEISRIAEKVDCDPNRAMLSIGSLGGGNHFIELGEGDQGFTWLTVHTGSRQFGYKIARYYQTYAKDNYGNVEGARKQLEAIPLSDPMAHNYLKDMAFAQKYAKANRVVILDCILRDFFKKRPQLVVESVHNYIDTDRRIIRKGAISANCREHVIIPFNMADGMVVGMGKGRKEWNWSAPHGSGRVMGRREAKRRLNDGVLTMNEFQSCMDKVWSSCVSKETIDESPMAYKHTEDILSQLDETVTATSRIWPVYNFKAD